MEIKETIKKIYELYKQKCLLINSLNDSFTYKKIRRDIFPEIVSEHLLLFLLQSNNTSGSVKWDTPNSGDLEKISLQQSFKIEVKCSSSTGPLSFGPTQKWDYLYIIDASDFINDNIKIYKINNKTDIFNVKVNKSQTFRDQCIQGRRPRLCLNDILTNVSHTKIFDDDVNILFN